MKLVKPTNALKKSKRVGRGHGSGLGTTAGRGHKGAVRGVVTNTVSGLKVDRCLYIEEYQ